MSDDTTTNSNFAPLPDEQSTKSVGQPLAKITTKQIAISREDIEKFQIDEDFVKEKPALVDLILKTESMKDKERKYWFQLMPVMNDEQIQKLQGILQNEKDQLIELDAKYEKEIGKLNEQPASQWNAENTSAKMEQIKQKESESEKEEKGKEDDILSQLENL